METTGKLTEGDNRENITKKTLTVMDSVAPELSEGACHGLVGSASCCTWAGAGITEVGCEGEIFVSARVNNYSTFSVIPPNCTAATCQEFFLVSYHWFSQWYPFVFSLLNAPSVCFLKIGWTVNNLSWLNLSDLWPWHCSMLLLLIKTLWLLYYKYVS